MNKTRLTILMLVILFVFLAFAIFITVVLLLMRQRQNQMMEIVKEIKKKQKDREYRESDKEKSKKENNEVIKDVVSSFVKQNSNVEHQESQTLLDTKIEKQDTFNICEPELIDSEKDRKEKEVYIVNSVSVNDNIHYFRQSPVSFKVDEKGMMNLLSDNTVVPKKNCFSTFVKTSFLNRKDFFNVFEFMDRNNNEARDYNQIRLVGVQKPAYVKIEEDSISLSEKGVLIVEEK